MPVIYMFGAAVSTLIIQGVVRRLYDNAHRNYVRTLNPPKVEAKGVIGFYKKGLG